jgi:hypothetical protein
MKGAELDTPLPKGERILGSVNPLKLDTLQLLAQRWFLPKREFGRAPPYLLESNSF